MAERIGHLYECQGLSTYRIAKIVGVDRQRVGRLLHRAGVAVKPRGAGRPRPPGDALAGLAEIMERLYVRRRLTSAQVAALTGVPERTVRDRLAARGVVLRTRGRCNREDRLTVAAEELTELYAGLGLSAAEAGRLLGVSSQVVLRAAHDHGIPVRVGGPAPRRGPAEIELVDALYADPLVQRALDRHDMRRVPAGGPISLRFPVRCDLARSLPRSCTPAAGSDCATSSCSPDSQPRPYAPCCTRARSRCGRLAAGRRSCAGGARESAMADVRRKPVIGLTTETAPFR